MAFPLLAIPALVQAGVGLVQGIQGRKRAKNLQRPTREVPAAVQEAVAASRYGAQAGQRPGSAMARERISGGQAAAVSQVGKAGGSAASTMAAALGAQKQAQRSMQEQDVMDMQFQQQQQMQYLNQLNNLAREQAANWQWNEAQQFQEEADAARRLQEGGMQNMMGGLMTGTQLGFMNKMGYLGTDEGGFLGGMFGGKKRARQQALDQTAANYASANQAAASMQMPELPQWQQQLQLMNPQRNVLPIPTVGGTQI